MLGGHSWDSQCQMAKGCCSSSHTIRCHAQHVTQGKEEVSGDIWSEDICLPKSPVHVVEPWFPGGGWTPVCPYEVTNEFLFCFVCSCLQKQLLLYLLNSISTHKFSYLYPSDPLPILPEGSKWEVEGLSCWLRLKNDGTLCMIVNVSLLWLSKCIHTVFF